MSNKKDWHILRKLAEKVRKKELTEHPRGRWGCRFVRDGITVNVTVRVGIELWNHFSERETAFLEMASAIIRACIIPAEARPATPQYTISDLDDILSLGPVPNDFNVSVLQRSQWEWLFFFARHFCDELSNA